MRSAVLCGSHSGDPVPDLHGSVPFQGYSGDNHTTVDQEYAAALQSQNNGSKETIDLLLKTTQSGIEGCTEGNKPLSCSDVSYDSEGKRVMECKGNIVQHIPQTITRQFAGAYPSLASAELPISSSETAEEQGDAVSPAHIKHGAFFNSWHWEQVSWLQVLRL